MKIVQTGHGRLYFEAAITRLENLPESHVAQLASVS
jgi:hypothetical protein